MKILIIIYIVTFSNIFAQVNTDSLLSLIKKLPPEQKIEYYNKLCWKNRNNNPQKAIEFGDSAIKQIKKLHKPQLLAKTYNYLSAIYRKLGSFSQALRYNDLALNIATKYSDSLQIGYAYNNRGTVYFLERNYSLALKNLYNGLNYFEAINNLPAIAYSTISLGMFYREKGDYKKALEFFNRTLKIRRKLNDKHGIQSTLLQIAQVYFKMKDYNNTLKFLTEHLEYYKSNNDFKGMADIYEGYYDVYYTLKNYRKALKNIEMSLSLWKKLNDKIGLVRTYYKTALIYSKLTNVSKAGYFLHLADSLLKKLDIPNVKADAMKYKYEYFKNLYDYKRALYYHEKYKTLDDSLRSLESSAKLANLQAVYTIEKKEKENLILKKDLELQNIQRNYLLLIILFILIIIAVYYWKYKTAKKLAAELSESNATKDKFFSILAHDLKNPIGTTMNYLQLLKNDFNNLSDKEKIEIIEGAGNSLNKNIKLLKNLLEWAKLQNKKVEYNPVVFNLNKIINDTVKMMMPAAKFKRINLTFNITDQLNCFCDVNMIKTVLRNLIGNALKFTNSGGSVNIKCKKGNKFITVTVTDNGVGISQEAQKKLFDITSNHTIGTDNELGTGLGLKLCKGYVERNGGKISFVSEQGKGSSFSFTLPLAKNLG